MEGQVDEKIKVERLQRLKALFEELVNESNEKKVGQILDILVEGKSKNNEEMYTGRTIDNKIVNFKARDEDIGKIKKIKIISNNKWYLTGEIQK